MLVAMTVEWTMQPHYRLLTLPVELRLCIYEIISLPLLTCHVPNIATSLSDRLQTLSSQLLGAVRYLTITLNLSLEPRVFDILDSSLPDMGLEQLTLTIRKPRPVESNRGPEGPFLSASSVSVYNNKLHSIWNLKQYICRALSRLSKVKRFSILHDGCYRSTQFAQFSRALETIMKSPEHNSDYWDGSLHAERNCIELVSIRR